MNGLTPSQTSGEPGISAAQAEALKRVENWLRRERRSRTVFRSDGRIDAIEETGVGRSSYGYDRRGDLTEITEANGRRTRYRYDERRRLAAVTHGDGSTTRHVYGDDGRLAATAQAAGVRMDLETRRAMTLDEAALEQMRAEALAPLPVNAGESP